jgi:hypothetical protein
VTATDLFPEADVRVHDSATEDKEIPDGSLDVVNACMSIHQQPERFGVRCYWQVRRLRMGGVVYVTLPTKRKYHVAE